MNVDGIGIPFKEQVRFETFRGRKGKNRSVYLHYMELERDFKCKVNKYQYELDMNLLGLSRSKTEIVRKQNKFQKTKDLINRERFKGNTEFLDFSEDSTPRYPGERRVRFPPVVSRSLTTLDIEQHYEVVEENEKVDQKEKVGTEELGSQDKEFADRIPERLYDDSKKPVKKQLADDAEKQLKLDETRVYIERTNSIFIGMPEGSVDEQGMSKRLVLPGLLKRWKRNAAQSVIKRKKKSKVGVKGMERKHTQSRLNLNLVFKAADVKEDGGQKAKQDNREPPLKASSDKTTPFHLRMLMPINEEESHTGTDSASKDTDTQPNPLITRMFGSRNNGVEPEKDERPRDARPLAARANTREARATDYDTKAIDAVMEETEKINIGEDT
jgi:hypothetical protein